MWVSLDISYLMFIQFVESVCLNLSPRYGELSSIISLNTFSVPLFFLSFWASIDINFSHFVVLQVLEALFTLISALVRLNRLLCRLNKLYSSVLKFIVSIFCHLHSTVVSIQWVFKFWMLHFSVLQFSFDSFFITFFFAETFYFFMCFQTICDWLLEHFLCQLLSNPCQIIPTSDSSQYWPHLIIFSHLDSGFPASWYDKWFSIAPFHLGYYVRKLSVPFNLPCYQAVTRLVCGFCLLL